MSSRQRWRRWRRPGRTENDANSRSSPKLQICSAPKLDNNVRLVANCATSLHLLRLPSQRQQNRSEAAVVADHVLITICYGHASSHSQQRQILRLQRGHGIDFAIRSFQNHLTKSASVPADQALECCQLLFASKFRMSTRLQQFRTIHELA